jgi:hypothetical protein
MSGRIFGILGKAQVGLSLQCHWLHLWSFWQVTGVVVAVRLPNLGKNTSEQAISGHKYGKERLENQPAERSTVFPGMDSQSATSMVQQDPSMVQLLQINTPNNDIPTFFLWSLADHQFYFHLSFRSLPMNICRKSVVLMGRRPPFPAAFQTEYLSNAK